MIDPAVKAHGLIENDNPQMDVFASLLANLAQTKNIAVDLLSHEKKGMNAEAGDVNRGRGASSVKDAARLVYTLTGMDKEAAGALGVSDERRKYHFRIDNAKVNIGPPDDSTRWFEMVGVPLENGTEKRPHGDNVQTCRVWEPPAASDGISAAEMRVMLTELGRGISDTCKYSTKPQAGEERAAWRLVKRHRDDKTEPQCRALIKTWEKAGRFVIGKYQGDDRHKAEGILSANSDVHEF